MTIRNPRIPGKPWKKAAVPTPPSKPTGYEVIFALALFLGVCAVWIAIDVALLKEPGGMPDWYSQLARQKGSSVEVLRRLLPFALTAAAITTLAVFVVRFLRWAGVEDGTLEDRIRKFVGAASSEDKTGKKKPWSGPFGVRLLSAGTTATAAAATVFLLPPSGEPPGPPRFTVDPQKVKADLEIQVVPDVRTRGPLMLAIEPSASEARLPLTVSAKAQEGLTLPLSVSGQKQQVEVAFTREEKPQPLKVELKPTIVDERPLLPVNFPDLLARFTLLEQTSWNLLRTIDSARQENSSRYVARGSPFPEPPQDRALPDSPLRATLPSTGDTTVAGPARSGIPPAALAVAAARLPERCSAPYFEALEASPVEVVRGEAQFDLWGFAGADKTRLVTALKAMCDALRPSHR